MTVQAPHGTARLFEEGEFATANGRAKLLAIHPQGPEQSLSAAYPLRLNTGRIRDQWHTMTRTARSPRLMNHRAEPFMDVHPDDADTAGVSDQGLAVLTAAKGEFRARVRVSNAQRRGEVFVPIHWTDCFTQQARSSALIDCITDPLSGQPESKHGAGAGAACYRMAGHPAGRRRCNGVNTLVHQCLLDTYSHAQLPALAACQYSVGE